MNNSIIKNYPDGSSYADVTTRMESFTCKVNSYEDLWYLGQILEVQQSKNRYSCVTIPNLIDAQADRRFNKNQSSGLKLVCRFLNQFENVHYRIFHPHNPEVVEALMDNVEIIDNSEFIKSVINDSIIKTGDDIGNLLLMSSDSGGFKPLMKLCDNIKWQGATYSASKSRNHETGKLTQLVSKLDFQGKDILIVDDICVYGGTFKGLSKLLKARNCGRLYLAVSHMTVQNLGEDPVTNYFDTVFCSNSKFNSYVIPNKDKQPTQPSNLEIVKLF